MHPIYGVFFPTREMPQNANFDLFIFKEKKKNLEIHVKKIYIFPLLLRSFKELSNTPLKKKKN